MLKKILLIGLPILLLVGMLGFVIWGETPLPATPQAVIALQSTTSVNVETAQGWTVFRPANKTTLTGLIFYPGGRVDYRAYAPLLRSIAEQGYLVVLVPMPLNLAVFGIEKAQDVINAFPQVKQWAIGGHSLGGSMAAQFVSNHPGKIAGLVFWASYPAGSLADQPIQVTSISASNDGLATPAKIADSRKMLPAAARFIAIQGGVHAQFGSYGEQPGDGIPAIPASAQWDQTVQATVELLRSITR
jgi:pimeloyl-ACP methyl ester carboxylesterase